MPASADQINKPILSGVYTNEQAALSNLPTDPNAIAQETMQLQAAQQAAYEEESRAGALPETNQQARAEKHAAIEAAQAKITYANMRLAALQVPGYTERTLPLVIENVENPLGKRSSPGASVGAGVLGGGDTRGTVVSTSKTEDLSRTGYYSGTPTLDERVINNFAVPESGGLFDSEPGVQNPLKGTQPTRAASYNTPAPSVAKPQRPRTQIQRESTYNPFGNPNFDVVSKPYNPFGGEPVQSSKPVGVRAGVKSVVAPIQNRSLAGTNVTARQLKDIESGKVSEESVLGLPETRQSTKVLPDVLPSSTFQISIPGITEPTKKTAQQISEPTFAGSLQSFAESQAPNKEKPLTLASETGEFFKGLAAPAINLGKLAISFPEGISKEFSAGSYAKAREAGEKVLQKQNLEPTLLNSLLTGKPTGKTQAYDIGSAIGEAGLVFAPTAASKILPRGRILPFLKKETVPEESSGTIPRTSPKYGPPSPSKIIGDLVNPPKTKTLGVKAFPQSKLRSQGYEQRPTLPEGTRAPEETAIEKAFKISEAPTKEVGTTRGARIPGLREILYGTPKSPRPRPPKNIPTDAYYSPSQSLPKTRATEIGKLKVDIKDVFKSDSTNPLRGILPESGGTVRDAATTQGPSISDVLKLQSFKSKYPNLQGKSVAERNAGNAERLRKSITSLKFNIGRGTGKRVPSGIGLLDIRTYRTDTIPLGKGIGFEIGKGDGGLGVIGPRIPPKPPEPPKGTSTGKGLQTILKEPEKARKIDQLLQIKPLKKTKAVRTTKPLVTINLGQKPKLETKASQISKQFFESQTRGGKKRQRKSLDRISAINNNIGNLYAPKQRQSNTEKERFRLQPITTPIFAPKQRQAQRVSYPTPSVQIPKLVAPQVFKEKLGQPFPTPPKMIFPEPPPKRPRDIIPIRFPPFGFGGGRLSGGIRPYRSKKTRFYTNPSDPLRAGVILSEGVPEELISKSPKVFKQIDQLLGKSRRMKGASGGIDYEPFKGFGPGNLFKKNLNVKI